MTPVSDNHDHRPPTGNLEEMFRQKFAEAELTPRADVWDRLDHELLLRENQGYRRRLVGYRRLAAAACAVATLGVGGWLTQRTLTADTPAQVAAVTNRAATEAAASRLGEAANASVSGEAQRSTAAAEGRPAGAGGAAADAFDLRQSSEGVAAQSPAADAAVGPGLAVGALRESFGAAPEAATQPGLVSRALATIKQTFGMEAGQSAPVPGGAMPGGRSLPLNGGNGSLATPGSALAAARMPAAGALAAPAAAQADGIDGLQPIASRLRRAAAGSRPDSVKPALLSAPVLLAAQVSSEEETDDKKELNSRWKWRGSYAAQRFVPNVSGAAGTGMALNFASPASPLRPAPVEEPTKLQPGLAQRGQLGVAVPLGKKHWTLLTGAELAAISGNTGREVTRQFSSANSPSAADQKFQTGRYHLTTIGVPVQVRYEGRKQGWGVYAAVGAAVNVLLRNRTDVGTLSATSDAPYRRVLASARGSAGVRFSPARGNWQLNVGPEAEAGLNTLNVNPSEGWSKRTRPYAVGLAASVEFGGGKAELAP
ncbi:hypothetical protein GCM10027048_13760 [Hymenobacter coalescens]